MHGGQWALVLWQCSLADMITAPAALLSPLSDFTCRGHAQAVAVSHTSPHPTKKRDEKVVSNSMSRRDQALRHAFMWPPALDLMFCVTMSVSLPCSCCWMLAVQKMQQHR